MKRCTTCKQDKALDEYPRHKNRKDGHGTRCKECQREYSQEWYQRNRSRRQGQQQNYYQQNERAYRDRSLRTKYGITVDEYEALLEGQEGVCAICEKPPTQNGGRNPTRLSVDHCHETGRIRGLLCRQCNYSLGCWGDNLKGVMRVVEYLRRDGGAHE